MRRAVYLLASALSTGCGAGERPPDGRTTMTDPSVSPPRRRARPSGSAATPPAEVASAPVASEAPASGATSPEEPPFRVAVRFACDEKYLATDVCDEVSWLAEVANDPGSRNLLDHDAGGPDGAIWNGNAPMVVIVPASVRSVTVGGASLAGGRLGELRIFRLPAETWTAALRPVPGKAYRAAQVRVDGEVAGEIWYAQGE